MNKTLKTLVVTAAASLLAAFNAQATLYNGNGGNGFLAGIGGSTLNITDDGNIVTFTLSNPLGIQFNGNDSLVFYLDTISGGLTDTSSLNDTGDTLRAAITQGNGSSSVVFPSGFTADKAIGVKPFGSNNNYAGLWDLTGNPPTLPPPLQGGNLTPDTAGQTSYTWSFSLANLGLSPGDSFSFVGIYLNADNGFLSNEGYGSGLPANNNVGNEQATFTSALTYTTIPEPSTYALIIGGLALLVFIARRRAALNS